jgi:ketosteroid isomerase-like protein
VSSTRHLELTKSAYAAALHGSYEDFLALLADEILIILPESLPHGGRYEGKEGARRLRAKLLGAWREFDVKVLEYLTGVDSVIGVIHLRGVLSSSAKAVDMRIAEYWRFRGDKVIELRAYYFDTHAVARLVARTAEI